MSRIMVIHDLNLASQFSDRFFFPRQSPVHDFGEPGTMITQENKRAVYSVDKIISMKSGNPHIVPLSTTKNTHDLL